jgi:hypothetical protein
MNLSVSGGLGIDFKNPSAFLGLGVIFHQNIVLTVGPVMNEEATLRPQYNEGDKVGAPLTSDQLHESKLHLSAFASLSLRLTGNPFGTATSKPKPAK